MVLGMVVFLCFYIKIMMEDNLSLGCFARSEKQDQSDVLGHNMLYATMAVRIPDPGSLFLTPQSNQTVTSTLNFDCTDC